MSIKLVSSKESEQGLWKASSFELRSKFTSQFQKVLWDLLKLEVSSDFLKYTQSIAFEYDKFAELAWCEFCA